jgi:hypothetical protein
MTIILFGILTLSGQTNNYFVRFNTIKECVEARKIMELRYGTPKFSGFCTKELK